jgi:sulfatase modifying factor 1
MLARRVALADDPGDLLWIDEVLATLPGRPDVDRVRTSLWQRFGTPDLHAWQDHFVPVAGGTFGLGSDDGDVRERPRHEVTLSAFWLGKTPITVAQYRQFWPTHRIQISGRLRRLDELRGIEVERGEAADDLPVTFVSWYAATMLCRWLRRHWPQLAQQVPAWRGLAPVLPTEAQAESAIRGGPQGSGEYWFGASDAAEDHAWLRTNSGDRAHAVGRKPANRLGLHDITGNVWWWCRDAYGPYPKVGTRPLDPWARDPSASSRVVRGGSFAFPVHDLRSAFRGGSHPADAGRLLGVRVALVAAPSELGSALDLRSLGM